ncbi:MAG: hypothetical protein RR178_09435 [Gordonibacter sp.]
MEKARIQYGKVPLIAVLVTLLAVAVFAMSGCASGGSKSTEKPDLNFLATSAVEPSERNVIDPGTYRIEATAGHGVLSVNGEGAWYIAADDLVGQSYGEAVYENSVIIDLKAGDKVLLVSLGEKDSPECEAEAHLDSK